MAGTDTVRNTFGISSGVQKAPKLIAGVELEIEDVAGVHGGLPHGWKAEEDGSLRNHGTEYISPPLEASVIPIHFNHIHEGLVSASGKANHFSDRTSIHVHVNCLDQTQDEVKSIVLWYALFEPLFFAMVDPSRSNNIHCVGLDQTSLSATYSRTLPIFVQKWSKYTALNLLPLSTQGTIEFRHMEGHNNIPRFTAWIKTLENLWTYGQANQLDKASIQSPSRILMAFDEIFKDSLIGGAPASALRHSVLNMVEDNVIDIKLALA